MKILTQVGSKERFVEIVQRVNKVKLNENVFASSGGNNNLAKHSFDELVNGTLKIQETNSETNDNETFVEIVGRDNGGNIAIFKFKVTSTDGDQEGVINVDSATLINFQFKGNFNTDMSEEDNAIRQLNAERGGEMVDVVSKYVGEKDNAPEEIENDSLYEDAIKLIDKVPYNKGTEIMKTNAAYADEQPTNPELRVHSDELSKFVSEILDYEEQPEGDPLDLPPDYGDNYKFNNGDKEDNIQQQISNEPEEEITPEKKQIILQAYDNLVSKGISAPTINQILAEIEKTHPVQNNQTSNDPESHMATGKSRVYPQFADSFLSEEDKIVEDISDEYPPKPKNPSTISPIEQLPADKKAFILKAIDNITVKKGRPQYAPNVHEIQAEINRMENGNLNETDYPTDMGIAKKIETDTDYPKPKKKHSVKKLKIKTNEGDAEEVITDEPMDDKPISTANYLTPKENPEEISDITPESEIQQLAQDKEERGEELIGGKGDGKSPLEFDPEQIIMGLDVEREHTDDPLVAIEIVLDHLSEDKFYYSEKEDTQVLQHNLVLQRMQVKKIKT